MMSVQKVRLQSTSRMSINDRFTGLQVAYDSTDGAMRQQRRQVVQASRKNQRLALQMEHRPAVIAALRGARGRGRGRVVAGGVLRSARGARGVIRVGAVVTEEREVPTRPYRSNTRAVAVPTTRGAFNRGFSRGARGSYTRGAGAGFNRGARGSFNRGARGAATIQGVGRGGSIRGINFKTGTPMRTEAVITRSASSGSVVAPVKKRLAVQGRLSQPFNTATQPGGGWVRGGFNSATRRGAGRGSVTGRLSGVRGRGGVPRGRGGNYTTRGAGFPSRTFRGRSRGGRGGNRGGGYSTGGQQSYSQQWENGF